MEVLGKELTSCVTQSHRCGVTHNTLEHVSINVDLVISVTSTQWHRGSEPACCAIYQDSNPAAANLFALLWPS